MKRKFRQLINYICSYFEMRAAHNRRETEIFIKHMPKWYKTLELNFKFFRSFFICWFLFSMPLIQDRFQIFFEALFETEFNWDIWNNFCFIITFIGVFYWLFYALLRFILGFVFIKEILYDKPLTAEENWFFNRVILVIFIIIIIILSLCWYYVFV